MLRAILFDFDGVLADTEPIHLRMFQKVLLEEGITLKESDYYSKYLGFDDRTCFQAVFYDQRKKLSRSRLEEMLRRKTRAFKVYVASRNVLLPGVKRVVRMLGSRFPLAIISGALRREILLILKSTELDGYFSLIVSAEDVQKGKPHPEGFRYALKQLNQKVFTPEWPLVASECLVIEDSHWGIEAARRAGMLCLAIATSYPQAKLRDADQVITSLKELTVSKLKEIDT